MTETNRTIQARHEKGLKRLRLRGRTWKDAIHLIKNPPTPTGLAHSGEFDFEVPRKMSGADIRLGVEGLPVSLVVSSDAGVGTRETADWIQENGSDEQKHAWQWWQVEILAGTWRCGYGYVDCWDDYRDWCRLSA